MPDDDYNHLESPRIQVQPCCCAEPVDTRVILYYALDNFGLVWALNGWNGRLLNGDRTWRTSSPSTVFGVNANKTNISVFDYLWVNNQWYPQIDVYRATANGYEFEERAYPPPRGQVKTFSDSYTSFAGGTFRSHTELNWSGGSRFQVGCTGTIASPFPDREHIADLRPFGTPKRVPAAKPMEDETWHPYIGYEWYDFAQHYGSLRYLLGVQPGDDSAKVEYRNVVGWPDGRVFGDPYDDIGTNGNVRITDPWPSDLLKSDIGGGISHAINKNYRDNASVASEGVLDAGIMVAKNGRVFRTVGGYFWKLREVSRLPQDRQWLSICDGYWYWGFGND